MVNAGLIKGVVWSAIWPVYWEIQWNWIYVWWIESGARRCNFETGTHRASILKTGAYRKLRAIVYAAVNRRRGRL
jgi:hypothetical protein